MGGGGDKGLEKDSQCLQYEQSVILSFFPMHAPVCLYAPWTNRLVVQLTELIGTYGYLVPMLNKNI